MDGQDDHPQQGKQVRRVNGRGAAKPAPSKPDKQTLQIRIDRAVKLKLEAHALGRGCTVSALVEELTRALPTEWVLSRRSSAQAEPIKPHVAPETLAS